MIADDGSLTPASQLFKKMLQVGRQRRFELERAMTHRVNEPQCCRVQGQALWREPAVALHDRRPPAIHLVAAYRVPSVGQMNVDLMRAPRLQPALDDGEIWQMLERRDVGDGALDDIVTGGLASSPISPVTHEIGIDRLFLDVPGDNGPIQPANCMFAKLPAEKALGLRVPRKHH